MRCEEVAAMVKEMYRGRPVASADVAKRLGMKLDAARMNMARARDYGLLKRMGMGPGAGWAPAEAPSAAPRKPR